MAAGQAAWKEGAAERAAASAREVATAVAEGILAVDPGRPAETMAAEARASVGEAVTAATAVEARVVETEDPRVEGETRAEAEEKEVVPAAARGGG